MRKDREIKGLEYSSRYF